MKNKASIVSAMSLAICLAFGAPAAANAANADPGMSTVSASKSASQTDEADFEEFVDALDVTEEKSSLLLKKFDRLDPEEKMRVASDPTSVIEMGAARVSTTTAPMSQRLQTSDINGVTAARYNVTARYDEPVYVFGVHIGSFHLKFRYVTGSGRVLSTTMCDSWFSGYSGFWSMSVESINHWVSAGQGTCVARHRGGLVYKGSSISMNKEMGLLVNGPGIVNKWIRKI